ncbi:uncharacterized protein AB675_4954 [Cyphellophora attinorum]|uniref:Uncharacterized protein n=1 Tax=Cyphellophora attinorum TaxID=1664694 RepID=A0A0N1HG39_9EURO|nr:uncharacterized protein AB675_4954 [Phialophora attinorum]KPI34285.1 hypothetical protein AB675_4954 [Phialophora attinorum]
MTSWFRPTQLTMDQGRLSPIMELETRFPVHTSRSAAPSEFHDECNRPITKTKGYYFGQEALVNRLDRLEHQQIHTKTLKDRLDQLEQKTLRAQIGQQKRLEQLERDVEQTFALFENEFDGRLERMEQEISQQMAAVKKEVLGVIKKWADGVCDAIAERNAVVREELSK